MYIFWFSQTSIETFFINVLLRQMFFSFYIYVFLLQKLIQRDHKRFEEQPSNPAHLWNYVVTWILYARIQVVVGLFAVQCAPPLRRGSHIKKCNQSFYKVVQSADWHCNTAPRPGFSPSILRHRGIWGVADKAVLNKIRKKPLSPKLVILNFLVHTFGKIVFSYLWLEVLLSFEAV
jgi:hypothetical protein